MDKWASDPALSVTPDDGPADPDIPAYGLWSYDAAPGPLTARHVAELRRDYAPGTTFEDQPLGDNPAVRAWIDALG